MGVDGKSFVNPVVGAHLREEGGRPPLARVRRRAVPLGMGGGNMPDPGATRRTGAGIRARSAMDNAMFAVNYFTPLLGGGVAYVDHKLTVQLEATVLQLFRVRGADATASSTDSARTNSTAGIHVGYFVIPQLSFGAELVTSAGSAPTDASSTWPRSDIPDASKDTMSVAIGPRGQLRRSGTGLAPSRDLLRAGPRQAALGRRRTTWCRSTSP